jgi:hypothetical protein
LGEFFPFRFINLWWCPYVTWHQKSEEIWKSSEYQSILNGLIITGRLNRWCNQKFWYWGKIGVDWEKLKLSELSKLGWKFENWNQRSDFPIHPNGSGNLRQHIMFSVDFLLLFGSLMCSISISKGSIF